MNCSLIAFITASLCLALAVPGAAAAATPARADRPAAIEFPKDTDWLNTDHPLTLAELKGKVVLLDFWTYCCINCMHVIPDLKQLEAKYPNELVVVGVHSAKFLNEQGTDNIREAILRYELTHPVLNDKDFKLWNAYHVDAWPSFILIDPDGKVIGRASGERVYDEFDRIIGDTVKEFDAQKKVDRTPMKFALERDKAPRSLLAFPGKLAYDPGTSSDGGRLFVSDSNHNRIVAIKLKDRSVEMVIGDVGGAAGFKDGSFADARFFRPQGVTVSGDGKTLYVADTENHAIRAVDLAKQTVTTLAGTGKQATAFNKKGRGTAVALNSPWDLLEHDGKLYIAMAGFHQIWTLDLKTLDAAPYTGTGREDIHDGTLDVASFAQSSGLSYDSKLLRLIVADSEVSAVRAVDAPGTRDQAQLVETIVGKGLFDFGDIDGVPDKARLQHPLGVLYRDNTIYVADTYNHKIRTIELAGGLQPKKVTTLIGTGKPGFKDGPADQAMLKEPSGLVFAEGKLYIADTNNNVIRVYDPATKVVSTLELTRIEKLVAAPKRGALVFHGEGAATQPAVTVAPGAGTIEIDVKLPKGYKLNAAAPTYIGVAAENPTIAAVAADAAERTVQNPTLPLSIPATFAAGKTMLAVDLVLYYCREDAESVCLVKQVRLAVPVEVSETGKGTVVPVTVKVE